MASGRRNPDRSAKNDFSGGEFTSIDILVGAVVRAQRGPFQRHTSENSTCARVAQNLGTHESVGVRGSVAAHRTRGDRSISTQLDLSAQNLMRAPAQLHVAAQN